MDLSKRVRQIREEKKLSQVEMAEKLGIERQGYHNLEKNLNKTSFDKLQKIADALGVTVKYLLFGEDDSAENIQIKDIQKEIEYLKKDLEHQKLINNTQTDNLRKLCTEFLKDFMINQLNISNLVFYSQYDEITNILEEMISDSRIAHIISEKRPYLEANPSISKKEYYFELLWTVGISSESSYGIRLIKVFERMLLNPFEYNLIIKNLALFSQGTYNLKNDIESFDNHFFCKIIRNRIIDDEYLNNIYEAYQKLIKNNGK